MSDPKKHASFAEWLAAEGGGESAPGRAAMAPEPDPTMPAEMPPDPATTPEPTAPRSAADEKPGQGAYALGDLPAKVWRAITGGDDTPFDRTPQVPSRYGTGGDAIMRGVGDVAKKAIPDALITAGNQATYGHTDYWLPKVTGHPGDAELVRGIEAKAAADSPRAALPARAVGATPLAIATGGMGPFASGAIAGGLQAHGDSESDSWSDQAWDVLKGSLAGGAVSKATGVVPAAASRVSRAATRWGQEAQEASLPHKLFATGMTAPEVRGMAPAYRQRFVDTMENQGIGGPLASTSKIAKQAERAQKAARAQAEPIEQSMQGTAVDPARITTPLAASRDVYPKGDTATQITRSKLTRDIAGIGNMDQAPGGGIPYEDVATARKVRGERTRDYTRHGWARDADAHVYDAYNEAVRGHADTINPGSGQALRDHNWNESVAISAMEAAERATMQDVAQPARILTAQRTGGMGLSPRANTPGGYASRGLLAALGRFFQGRGHSLAGANHSVAASDWRGLAGQADALRGAYDSNLGQGARMAASGQAGAGFARAARSPEEREATMQAVTNEARGYRIPEATRDTLANNPEVLGPYAQQLSEAADRGDAALVSTIIRLQQDPKFRMGPLLELQKLTAAKK